MRPTSSGVIQLAGLRPSKKASTQSAVSQWTGPAPEDEAAATEHMAPSLVVSSDAALHNRESLANDVDQH
jgi:hypothetical protein